MDEKLYLSYKKKLLTDNSICKENKALFKKFFEFEEVKLKRRNRLKEQDKGTLNTLYGYVYKLRNINTWFKNKPLKNITKKDILKVYNDLEDGIIVNARGSPVRDTDSVYDKIFKGKLFRMINKKEIAEEILEEFRGNRNPSDVRFISEDQFRKMVSVIANPTHKSLAWLAFDVGENINTLLQLKKKDFFEQENEQKEKEYRVNLHKDILKRSRRPRSVITNYKETYALMNIQLSSIGDDDQVWSFQYRAAYKFLERAVRLTKMKCTPNGELLRWKDVRSSMACDLLVKHWTGDEIKSRLGHSPSSTAIDRYINFLAINEKTTKKKIYHNDINKLAGELEESKSREQLNTRRMELMKEEMKDIKKMLGPLQRIIKKS